MRRTLTLSLLIFTSLALAQLVDITSPGGGLWSCRVDGVQVSQHSQEYKASAQAADLKLQNPDASVVCDQDRSIVANLTAAGRKFVADANAGVIIRTVPTPVPPSELPEELTFRSDTFHSIGIEWDLTQSGADADHDATVTVEYKKTSSGTWLDAMDLMRGDFAPFYDANSYDAYDHFAGSIMFLTPGQAYDVRVTYDDPDNTDPEDGNSYEFETTTRAIPVKPTSGTTYYAVAGSGSGNAGTSGDPFEGLEEADAAVSPGDIVKLRDTNGIFTGASELTTKGSAGNYILYEPDTGHSPVIEQIHLKIYGDAYLWFDNLTFTSQSSNQTALGSPWAATHYTTGHVVVTGNTFTGYNEAVRAAYGTSTGGPNWTVMDNTIVGDKAAGQGSTGPTNGDGYGVIINTSGGHVIAYNTISRVADGIGISQNSDAYGNDVFDVTDDNTTNDGKTHNIRIWGNRLADAAAYAISAQPQAGSPWYYLYNVMVRGDQGSIGKFRVVDRTVFIGNTVSGSFGTGSVVTRWFTRNNLFVQDSAPVWGGFTTTTANNRATIFVPTWETDVDYDGFWYGGAASNAFRWYDPQVSYGSVSAFNTETGMEANGIEADNASTTLFVDYDPSNTWDAILKAGANAIDAGAVVDNLADFHVSTAPDMGAQEDGGTALQFGVRTGELSTALASRTENWIKH